MDLNDPNVHSGDDVYLPPQPPLTLPTLESHQDIVFSKHGEDLKHYEDIQWGDNTVQFYPPIFGVRYPKARWQQFWDGMHQLAIWTRDPEYNILSSNNDLCNTRDMMDMLITDMYLNFNEFREHPKKFNNPTASKFLEQSKQLSQQDLNSFYQDLPDVFSFIVALGPEFYMRFKNRGDLAFALLKTGFSWNTEGKNFKEVTGKYRRGMFGLYMEHNCALAKLNTFGDGQYNPNPKKPRQMEQGEWQVEPVEDYANAVDPLHEMIPDDYFVKYEPVPMK